MAQKWIYKLVCPTCGHSEIDEFEWETCSRCGEKLIVTDKWPGGQ